MRDAHHGAVPSTLIHRYGPEVPRPPTLQPATRKEIGAIKKCVYGEAEFLPQHIRTISAVNYLEPTFCGFPPYMILVSFHTPCIMSKISSVLVFYSIFNNLK